MSRVLGRYLSFRWRCARSSKKVRKLNLEGETILSSGGQKLLQEIGNQLDCEVFPRVFNGGVVKSGEAHVVSSTPDEHKEHSNVRKRERKSSRRPRQGQGARPRSPGSTPRLSNSGLRKSYQTQMREVEIAYPDTVCWEDERGMWLLVRSAILEGLDRHATFLIALPFELGIGARSWAYWTKDGQHEWMGRRHTNFPDGSICAFAPTEGVWFEGGDLITLLDLYSVWALRQLHFLTFGRWPGPQHMNSVFYRLREFQDDELCSCSFGLRYKDCCKQNDLSTFLANPMRVKAEFDRITSGCQLTDRTPPSSITNYLAGKLTKPPTLADALCL
jgi:hypothetical protein